tara:strand:+ start:1823 stop:2182 length:360 start_codon:yes stop_codon:yes gene_type:complete
LSKFRNVRVEVDGYKFDSKAEAAHYLYTLKPLLESGEIINLKVHPRYPIEVNRTKICTYIADFQYTRVNVQPPEGEIVVEDVKGYRTEIYKLKKKLVEATYIGMKISEISPKPYRSAKL